MQTLTGQVYWVSLPLTAVQTSPDGQKEAGGTVGPTHTPLALQKSAEVPGVLPLGAVTTVPVQALPSSQGVLAGAGAGTHEAFGSVQALTMHGLPVAGQDTGVPVGWQTPAAHLSAVPSQARPSVQVVPSAEGWLAHWPPGPYCVVVFWHTLSWHATPLGPHGAW
jgi:hypothetical protein